MSSYAYTSVIESDLTFNLTSFNTLGRRRDAAYTQPVSFNGGDIYYFTVELPSMPVLTFEVAAIVQGVQVQQTAFEVLGIPGNYTQIVCAGMVSNVGYVHSVETVMCNVTIYDDFNETTTGLPSDFAINVNYAPVRTVMTTTDGGYTYHFFVTSPNNTLTHFLVDGYLKDGNISLVESQTNLTLIC